MKLNIVLKGEKSKKYFLDKISQGSGVYFKDIPKTPIIIEVRKASIATQFFQEFLSQNILDEVNFEIVEAQSREKNSKRLGNKQQKILLLLKSQPNQLFSFQQLLENISISESNLKRILTSLLERNLIQEKEEGGVNNYYFPSEENGINNYYFPSNAKIKKFDSKNLSAYDQENMPQYFN